MCTDASGTFVGSSLLYATARDGTRVPVSLVHRKGYLQQSLDGSGAQSAQPDGWDPAAHLEDVPLRCEVTLEGRSMTAAGRGCSARHRRRPPPR